MRKRTRSREIALNILYSSEIVKETIEESELRYWSDNEQNDEMVKDFANAIIGGVKKHFDDLDKIISKYAENWKIERMAVIDRNVLRIACYELLYIEDIPPKVSINEAIDIAKKYGNKDSGKFVNGILDRVKNEEEVKGE